MKKIILLILFLVFIHSLIQSVNAQTITFGGGIDLGTYSMNDLKDFQEYLNAQVPVDISSIETYPAFFRYTGFGEFSQNKISFGLQITYESTGSRSSYKDYSGEIRFDQIVSAVGVGTFISYSEIARLPIYVKFVSGLTFSDLSLLEYVEITNQTIEDKYEYKSMGYFSEAHIGYELNFKFINLTPFLSYRISFNSETFKNSNDNMLIIPPNREIKPNFTGFRLGINVSIII